ncbi:aldo/keto reductase [Cognatishimia activa]|uniref:Aldo/keto reductase n=1 Tax=Cognatishimia activa TaxID=1715691 RepID=A0A975EMR3_9RHOB|nr:aldo/keto reductase [Cognatishimia activa]QTN34879.1 aldo/keto reductase [Cognatishimia activa]
MSITAPDGTAISKFTYGTMQFGDRADRSESQAMFEASTEAGITHFDTAYVYTEGASETLLGEFAAKNRDSLIIATKVGYTGGAGRDNMLAQFDISRQRLGMDMVDILYLHRFDPATELKETLDTFATLKAEGKIRYVGLSNFAAWQVMKAVQIAKDVDLSIDILQPMYNLVKRQAEVEIFPMAQDQDITLAPYSPLGGGLLTGKYARGGTGRLSEDDRYNARYGQDWMRDCAARLAELADAKNVSPASLAVAWAAAHPANPHPILSARSLAQLRPSLAAAEVNMSPELYAEIEALSQRPAPATDRLEEAG